MVGGVVVGSDALPSSSPSLIWLQLGFGLARAVTIDPSPAENFCKSFMKKFAFLTSLQNLAVFGMLPKCTLL